MNIILAFLRSLGLISPKTYHWVVEDPRPADEVRRDYLHEERELAGAKAVEDPFRFDPITTPAPIEDQKDVGSCVPHGVGLALALLRATITGKYIRFAWTYIYRLRSNYPFVGCWLQDIFDKYKKGVPLYATLPDPQTESQATKVVITPAMQTEAEIFKGLEYYMLTQASYSSIDELAKIAATGISIPICIYSTYDEWAQSIPEILSPNLQSGNAEVRHCIAVLPYSGHMRRGKKYITIQDSAHFGGYTLRHVSEDFIKARVYGAGYWLSVALLGSGPAPRYVFKNTLRLGSRGEDVRNMQLLFISLGLLPDDCATGLFAGRTLAALHAFQTMFADEILTPQNLITPTDNFGSGSMKKANALCSSTGAAEGPDLPVGPSLPSNPSSMTIPSKIIAWAHLIAAGEGASTASNNPGNLKYSSLTASWGAAKGRAATDGGFLAKFPTYEMGFNALCSFLLLGCEDQLIAFHLLALKKAMQEMGHTVPKVRSLDAFTRVYAGNPPQGYVDHIVDGMGGNPGVDISTFLS